MRIGVPRFPWRSGARRRPSQAGVAAGVAWLLGSAVACTSIVDWSVGAGIGAPCSSDEQCQGSSCIDDICASPCEPDGSCPGGTVCADRVCQVPSSVAFLLPGPVGQEDLSYSFELARQELEISLRYVSTSLEDELFLSSEAATAAQSAIASGHGVVVGARPAYGPAFAELADQNPEVSVLVHGARVTRPNLVAFDVRAYQGTYLAGIAAARKTSSRRLCFVASAVTPSVVARVNGFVIGARSVDPSIVVEVSWIGDWHDTQPPVNGQTRERLETLAMLGRGCDVVAHSLDNNIPVSTVGQQAPPGVFVIGANVETACELAPGRCLGTLVFRWAPILEELVDDAHRARLTGGRRIYGIRVSDTDSPMSFRVPSNLVGAQSISAELDAVRAQLATEQGVGSVFDGPLRSTGQCEALSGDSICVAEGERVAEGELADMCWLVDGAIAFDASLTLDVPALVPAEGDCVPPDEG
jgi:basic membrane protein A and related proteins